MKLFVEIVGVLAVFIIGFAGGWFKHSNDIEKYENNRHPETMGTHTNREL